MKGKQTRPSKTGGLFDETKHYTTKIGEEPYIYTVGELESLWRQQLKRPGYE